MNIRMTIGALALALTVTGCMGRPTPLPGPGLGAGILTGTVNYRERMALPPVATVEISIVDVALQDAPSRTIASTRFATRGRQVPIPFVLRHRADRRTHAEYAVQARIKGPGGELLYITDTRNAMPAGGRIDLWLVDARR